MKIRDARTEDAARLSEIFNYYVLNTAVSFEYEAVAPEEFARRMREIMKRYPYLVAEEDGMVQGYACAHPFVGRAAYDWSCEVTIYLDPAFRGRGAGRALYTALEAALREMGILNLYACIGVPEQDDEYLDGTSPAFHARMGYVKVGEFKYCGRKFGRWYHMIWMEKVLGEHGGEAPERKAYRPSGS